MNKFDPNPFSNEKLRKRIENHFGKSLETIASGDPLPSFPTVGEMFKAARKENFFTQKEVAEHAGIDIRTYQRYESNELSVLNGNFETIATICTMLGIQCESILLFANIAKSKKLEK